MRIIDEKYRKLKPSLEYLSDEVVIAQAWKKTHGYIRSFNWYADPLELDVSALNIEQNAKNWGEELRADQVKLHPIEFIPASKSEKWHIDEGKEWKSCRSNDAISIRPLAHISIRDQTWATAAMMCLADTIETVQGRCDVSPFVAQKNKVYSYGNRLLCEWKGDKAWFRWGNSEIYRKFFIDYQSFINRPLSIGRHISDENATNDDIYVVSLDLTKFYNKIDRPKLINKIKKTIAENKVSVKNEFWKKLETIFSWEWRDKDLKLAKENDFDKVITNLGLPQGLVSAGFFSNIYLIDFDQNMGKLIGKDLGTPSITLHDYCRYVDDLRLVISAENTSVREINDAVNKFIAQQLNKGYGELAINESKTKITRLQDLDNQGSMSNRIKLIQNELSGPTDRTSLESITGVLENLLNTEDSVDIDIKSKHKESRFIEIANFDHDIRSDTLKRFAANRLESIVKNKRKITFESEFKTSKNEAENELLAKKLIYAWMKDPSLALVLRKAIEIYPDANLFEPVFDSIFLRSSFSTEKESSLADKIIMDYLLADLFRCGCDLSGVFQNSPYPDSIDANSVIELLTRYAQKIISCGSNSHDYVIRQAMLLLAISNKPSTSENKKLSLQNTLNTILSNQVKINSDTEYVLFEIASQITGNYDTYASLLMEALHTKSIKEQEKILLLFAKRGGLFWISIWKKIINNKYDELATSFKWAKPLKSTIPVAKTQILAKIISSEKMNGFRFEHGVIKLALGLIKLIDKNEDITNLTPTKIRVEIETNSKKNYGWNEIWQRNVKALNCSIKKESTSNTDPRFTTPAWITKKDPDAVKLYWIGCILRASILGGCDYTGMIFEGNNINSYKGLRSTWYKRRMGMLHSPEALVGEYATVSDWTSDLLMRCLQWPGFESTHLESNDILAVDSLSSFKKCLINRLKLLNAMICKNSNTPSLPTRINTKTTSDSLFRIVTVQSIIPSTRDFSFSDPQLNNKETRAKHREHIAAICKLALNTLEVKVTATGDSRKPYASLIVFPEVSVHIDDQDIIKRLADKANAIVFAGMVFTNHKGELVNIARWFIPDYRDSGRQWVIRDQGKHHMTSGEAEMGVVSHRPCQHILEVHGHAEGPFKISGAICYDATDIRLATDLRDQTDLFVVVAHNKDVNTFDNMAAALQWHMYQHVVICNIGEFGGSTIQAPFKHQYDRLISHVHGTGQIAISMADIDLAAFRRKVRKYKEVKTPPAGRR